MTSQTAPGADEAVDRALALISAPPTTSARGGRPHARADRGRLVRGSFAGGVAAATEAFAGYSTFAEPYGLITALAACRQRCRGGGAEVRGDLGARRRRFDQRGRTGPHAALRAPLAAPERQRRGDDRAARGARRTLCLMAHLDASRSRLLFEPRLAGLLNRWTSIQSLATLILPAEPWPARRTVGRALLTVARGHCLGLFLLAERELRGATFRSNDNASGVGVVAQLAAEAAGLAAARRGSWCCSTAARSRSAGRAGVSAQPRPGAGCS